MLQNYLKIAFRNLLKQKFYSSLNILGLALGIACCLLILLYIRDELNYDKYHEKSEQIYRFSTGYIQENGLEAKVPVIPAMWAPTLKSEFPEVRNYVRFYKYRSDILVQSKENEKSFYEGNFFWADSTVFDIFTFPVVEGNPETALVQPNSVVISQTMAEKYFGDESPIGHNLTYVNRGTVFELHVTGVMKDVPSNSHFHPEFIASLSTFKPGTWHWAYDLPTSWTNTFYYSYILLQENADYQELQAKLPAFLEKHIGEEAREFKPFLQPLTGIHLHSNLGGEFEANSSILYVYIFTSIAFLILFVACINYINLATARSFRRSKEVGLRKTLGSNKTQLVLQFYGESFLMTVMALLIAFPIVETILPFFNQLAGKTLELNYFDSGTSVLYFIGFLFLVGIIAGSYPALYLSRFNPVDVLKGRPVVSSRHRIGVLWSSLKSHSFLRKMLVVFQFAITVFLIISTGVIAKQLDFFRQRRLGLDEGVIITIPLRGNDVFGQYANYKSEILQNTNIASAAASSHIPFTDHKQGSYKLPEILGSEVHFESDYFVVDPDFGKLFNLEIVNGRDFSVERDGISDNKSFILSERAVQALGITNEQAIGKHIDDPFWQASGQIVGVVKDFHYRSMHSEIGPLVIKMDPRFVRFLSVKISSEEFMRELNFLEEKWLTFFPDSPFYYTFLDDDLNHLYKAEEKMGELFNIFSAIAIVISCLGLFGLASFSAEQRTKEIGVRKVLGASVADVIILLTKDFTKLIIAAFLVAMPCAALFSKSWLQEFAYRTDLEAATFLFAGLFVLLIAWITVGYQSVRAALSNPVEALRYE